LILSLLIRISIVIILLFIGEIKGYLIIFLKIFLKNESTYRFSCIYFKKKCLFPVKKERINAYPFFNSKKL